MEYKVTGKFTLFFVSTRSRCIWRGGASRSSRGRSGFEAGRTRVGGRVAKETA